jgi:hypothetical protein
MKNGDRLLQAWRYSKAKPFTSGTVLDVGCYDGTFLSQLPGPGHVGIDVSLKSIRPGLYQLKLNEFDCTQTFDTITCLATYEHFDDYDIQAFWLLAKRYVTPFGRVVMTVPHPWVDPIIQLGKKLRVLDGMDEHQHRPVDSKVLSQKALEHGFVLVKQKAFQLGLNRLYVFEQKERARA